MNCVFYIVMAAFIGQVGIFDETVEQWPIYVERAEQFFLANAVDDALRVPSLLSMLGSKTYALLRNLVAPDKPADKTFAEINQVLTGHLSPKPLLIAERFRFHKRNQEQDETVAQYFAMLKKLAEHCNFGQNLNDTLRDRLVCGMRNENIQKRLLAEANLSHTRAIELATAMESAQRDTVELRKSNGNGETSGVHYVRGGKTRQSGPAQCHRCGSYQHTPDRCIYKEQVCFRCSKTGHTQKMCLSPAQQGARGPYKGGYKGGTYQSGYKGGKPATFTKGQRNKPVHAVVDSDEETYECDTYECASLEVHQVGSKKGSDVIWVTPQVEGRDLRMELDTGSAISAIPLRVYKQHYGQLQIKRTDILLKSYTGQQIKPKGTIDVEVVYKGEQHKLHLYVIDSEGPPLFGRDWLRKIRLDWCNIREVHTDASSTKGKLDQLLAEYSDVFADGLGLLKGEKAKLTLTEGATPKFFKPRQVPYALRPMVEEELQKLEKEGILSKVDWSEWATPLVAIPKSAGGVRICGDFKVTINPVLKVDQYPLPRIEDIFSNLAGGERFTKLDLRQAYLQMEVSDESKQYLTVNTHKGLYQWNRLMFGVASAPAIWQRTIDKILQGLPGTQCILDDMIITGRNDDEHLENLRNVLERLHSRGLRANLDKCAFRQERIEYCGHIIDKQGLHKTNEKIEAVLSAPSPENLTQLRSFIGMVQYYHKFLNNIATVLRPLNQLLEKNQKWIWSQECEHAFKEAKRMITSKQVLAHYDPSLPIALETDASPYGISCVMTQNDRPVAFASRSLTTTERAYAQIQKEALAIVFGVKKFHHYVFARHFTLITDHQPLTSIFHPNKELPAMTAARLQRYAMYLSGHNYTIKYRNTKLHVAPDCLSRLPLPTVKNDSNDPVEMFHVDQLQALPVSSTQMRRETQRDIVLSKVYLYLLNGWPDKPDKDIAAYYSRRNELTLTQGCILWGIRVIVPRKLQTQVTQLLHEAHLGIVKMKGLARSHVWWPGIDNEIENTVKQCQQCKEVRNNPSAAPLHPWECATSPWQRIHVDYAGEFQGHMFLLAVDAHSQWPEVEIMRSTTSSKTIDTLRAIFARNGLPEQLVSDNGSNFVSAEFETFLKQNGIKHVTSAPYHPSTNGLVERLVQTLKQSLKAGVSDRSSTFVVISECSTYDYWSIAR